MLEQHGGRRLLPQPSTHNAEFALLVLKVLNWTLFGWVASLKVCLALLFGGSLYRIGKVEGDLLGPRERRLIVAL